MLESSTPRRRRRSERTLLIIELHETLTAVDIHLPDWQAQARSLYAKATRSAAIRNTPQLLKDVERLRAKAISAREVLEQKTDQLSPRARMDSRVADRFRALDCVVTTLDQIAAMWSSSQRPN
jgi:hypothetical protein